MNVIIKGAQSQFHKTNLETRKGNIYNIDKVMVQTQKYVLFP